MDVIKGKGKKGNLIVKTWERCRCLGHGSNRTSSSTSSSSKNKSWPGIDPENNNKSPRKKQVAPEGCFSVYVGPQKQKFVVKTEYANHPLFKILLEEAESEYGFNTEGPLELPCDVDVFWKVLLEIEYADKDEIRQLGCGLSMRSPYGGSYRLLSPSRLVAMNHF